MKPRLVGCLFASMLVGGCASAAAMLAGFGPLIGLLTYTLAGSLSLVPFAVWASHEAAPRPEIRVPAPAKPRNIGTAGPACA